MSFRYRNGKVNSVDGHTPARPDHVCGEYSHLGFISRQGKEVDTEGRENADLTSHNIVLARNVHQNPRLKDEPGSGEGLTCAYDPWQPVVCG